MDIINRIKAALHLCNKEISISKETQEVVIYDEEHLRLQKLYEKWVCKEKWLLHKEGIPLLLGMDPEHYDIEEGVSNKILELPILSNIVLINFIIYFLLLSILNVLKVKINLYTFFLSSKK